MTARDDKQRLAFVTGAAGVLGNAICVALLDDNYRVIMVDHDQAGLATSASRLGRDAIPLALDLKDTEALAQACAMVRREHGNVSVLVNNAGILSNHKAAETSDEEWASVMSVNLDAAFRLCREFLPAMKEAGWGRIVNIGSLAQKTGGLTAGTAYTVSKGGLTALTLSLAREAASRGVTVNAVAPAYIKTPMVTEQLTQAQRDQLLAQIPVGRFCEGDEVAHTVRYLVHPLCGFVTGEVIDINGGLHMD